MKQLKTAHARSIDRKKITRPARVIFFPINDLGMGRFQMLNLGVLGYGLKLRGWVVIVIIGSLTLTITFTITTLRLKKKNSFRSPRASLQILRVNVFFNKKKLIKNYPCFSATKENVKHFQMLQYCILRRA